MDKADQPRYLIGFLFALSIAFWAVDMTEHVKYGLCTPPVPDGECMPFNITNTTPMMMVWMLTSAAGIVFLADIICIIWWYVTYIYKIQATPILLRYFLDFSICAMFLVAANDWTAPKVFVPAVLGASLLLIWRFATLYRSHDANDTDKRILRVALRWLALAACISFAFLSLRGVLFIENVHSLLRSGFLHPILVIILSGIGIWLTARYREKIRISVELHEAGTQRFIPMELYWPPKLAEDVNSKLQITEETRKGLHRFRALFQSDHGDLGCDRLHSRVHPEGDLRVQSYILATGSWTPDEESKIKANEVTNKAFMVGASHWIDDLVDGRGDLQIYNKLRKEQDFGLAIERAEEIFEQVYKSVIIQHTNSQFYGKLLDQIKDSAPIPDNRKYLFFSLNRVAAGAALFGPRVKERHRKRLVETHNAMLVRLVKNEQPGGNDPWYQKLLNFLGHMRAEPSGVGKVLLGLTTKTVQEMAMASESQEVRFAQSLLYSLLYAPLLYFHDVDGELACSEIVPLEVFDVNYDAIFPWLSEMRELIESPDAPIDPRRGSRIHQLSMAFRCFSPKLPKLARNDLAEIYDPNVEKAQVSPP